MTYRVPRMDDLESRAWLSLLSTMRLLPNALDSQLLASAGLTEFEYAVLVVLNQADESKLATSRLAEQVDASLPRLSKVLTRLAKRGLVERSTNPADRRVTDVHLTQDGRRTMILATPGHVARVRELVIDTLSREQLAALADALEPVVATLDPHGRTGLARG
ncbi:MarR family winged helix-turn-helix transcriptional regulator [Agromyces seonyuensis]|uniref:MarR family transcriptional regulator n=1 Tax=Agromyces seonyuensis TaxID=2662446 RepID=A0A6I4NSS6_9MICO|nr:MarR family transcriptional regulator [Agromyces seonyuensis]MWB97230.1 MarR family transcriptional regulator [Agromyces seonyuensis]